MTEHRYAQSLVVEVFPKYSSLRNMLRAFYMCTTYFCYSLLLPPEGTLFNELTIGIEKAA